MLYQDLIDQGFINVNIIAIGKGQYSNDNSNWTDNNILPVIVDPSPNEVWDNWGASQWNLFFLDAQAQYVTEININPWDYNAIYNTIMGLIIDCADPDACNYHPGATFNAGCYYAADNHDCNGNCIADVDCNGECGGTAVVDDCDVCGGNGPKENHDCNGNCIADVDCNGECGGTAVLDACGICGGTITNVSECGVDCTSSGANNLNQYGYDCNGLCNGSAVEDECGVCSGSGSPENYNCAGICTALVDCNGACGGSLLNSCIGSTGDEDDQSACEAAGGYWSPLGYDECEVCGGQGAPANYNCALQCIVDVDCNGICGGTAVPAFECQNGTKECTAIECQDLGSIRQMLPEEYSIVSIYPNPFNPVATIHYTLPENTYINLLVYDISGRQVANLLNGFHTAGYHTINWDASYFPSGVYFVQLTTSTFSQVRKLALVK